MRPSLRMANYTRGVKEIMEDLVINKLPQFVTDPFDRSLTITCLNIFLRIFYTLFGRQTQTDTRTQTHMQICIFTYSGIGWEGAIIRRGADILLSKHKLGDVNK